MIIRQAYTEGSTGKQHVKEIHINLEEMRTSASRATSEAKLIARLDNYAVNVNPDDKILSLLDTKRTFVPYGKGQTHLVEKMKNSTLFVDSTKNLLAERGDPIAVFAQDGNIYYYLIDKIRGNTLEVMGAYQILLAGNTVRNLKHGWWSDSIDGELGINAKLSQLPQVPFSIRADCGTIHVLVHAPINWGSIRYYDVYVRNSLFTSIGPWFPDISDVPVEIEQTSVESFGGGEEAGGGPLVPGIYYATVVFKDAQGLINVNESPCKQIDQIIISR